MDTPVQELISLSSPELWKSRLKELPHQFGHTWEHCQAMHLSTGQPTYLYYFKVAGHTILCPISERTYQGHTDIVTPYGFNGFITNGDYQLFNIHWKKFMKSKGYVCGYFGLNPLWPHDLGFPANEINVYSEIHELNLTQPLQTLISQMSENRKRQLKKMERIRNNLSMDKEKLTGFFLEQYENFIQAKSASRVYHFSTSALKLLVEQDNVFMTGYIDNEKVEAVSVFGYTNYAADFLFNVNTVYGKETSFALIWMAIEKLKSMNIPLLNLGGGVKNGDALSAFKKRFGGEIKSLASVQQVYDPEVFQQLCIESGVDMNQKGYFPPYRLKTH